MKIFFVSSGLKNEYGGAPISETSLVKALKGEIEIVLACPVDRLSRDFAVKMSGIEPFSFHRLETIFAFLFKRNALFHSLKSCSVAHINGHWRWENFFIALTCRSIGIPYLIHPRGMLWPKHGRARMKKIFNWLIGNYVIRHASKIVGLSHFEKTQWNTYPVSDGQIEIIPNGFSSASGNLSGECDAKSQIAYLLYVGRVEPRKNLEMLVRAFSDYRAEGGQLKLRLVGPEEKNYAQSLKQLVREQNLHSVVSFEPPVYGDEKWGLMAQAAAVIYPSVQEAFGRVPFEAVIAGSIPVAPVESGSYEYLQRFFEPYFFSFEDDQALAKVLHVVEKFPCDIQKKKEARDFILYGMSWKIVSGKVLQLYRRMSSPELRIKKAL